MPDWEAWRISACVPRRSGAWSPSIDIVTTASPLGVMSMSLTEPTGVPPSSTWLPFTSWLAFMKWALTV